VKFIAAMAAGHLMVDINQGALPALLPHLKAALHLSYFAASALVLTANVTSSVVQPIFGYLADRDLRRWVIPVSIILSGLGLGLTGVAPHYPLLLVLVGLMGLGVASFHPLGFKTVADAAGLRKATAVSWFSLGGNLGFALGPPLLTLLITYFGMYGSLGMILPTLLVGVTLLVVLPRLGREVGAAGTTSAQAAEGKNMPRAMSLLIFIVMIRSWTQLGFMTFLPFYYIDYLKAAPRMVGPVLFVFLGAGALGTIAAGPLADRWGTRNFIVWGFLGSILPGVATLLLRGNPAIAALGVFGAVLLSTTTVTVVLGQQYLPRSPGLASGLIAGFAIGAGGLGVTVMGWVADRFGLPAVLWIAALLPLTGFLACLFLPHPAGQDKSSAQKYKD
jgi:FSR family fosmidomycin resistance protein-like MFS transporter